MNVPEQSLLIFEQAVVDAKCVAEAARVQAKLTSQAQRAILKRQAEIDKVMRRFRRERQRKQRTFNERAQCGIRWYDRSPQNVALGNYWKHCHDCGQLLIYTSDPHAKPQICAGRKP